MSDENKEVIESPTEAVVDVPVPVAEEPVAKPKRTKKAKATETQEDKNSVTEDPSFVRVPRDKYNKLVEGAKAVLTQYKSNHRELRYPGLLELEEGLS